MYVLSTNGSYFDVASQRRKTSDKWNGSVMVRQRGKRNGILKIFLELVNGSWILNALSLITFSN